MRNLKSILTVLAALVIFSGCSTDEDKGTLSISLSQTGTFDFPSETSSSYAQKTPLTVTVSNTGTKATGKLSIAIDGPAADKFNLSVTSIANIETGKNSTFTVVPEQGLDFGDYKATVYVSGKDIAEQTFNVRFVVTELVVSEINIKTLPEKRVYGISEPLDLTGLQVMAVSDGSETPIEIKEEYLIYDFTTPGEKKVGIAVGSAPIKEFDVTVLSLPGRIAAAAGTTATIILYASETFANDDSSLDKELVCILIDKANTDITLTTPESSTEECVIKKDGTGYFFNVRGAGGGIRLTLDGYVTVKGHATPDYGGTDEYNNNNYIISLSGGASFEMKGRAKVTGNCNYQASGGVTGGAINIAGAEFTIGENAQLTNNWAVCTAGGAIAYGGAFYAKDGATITVKDNAKIAGNVSLSKAGNAYGGVAAAEKASLYMKGGEISGNSAQSLTGIAGGGVLQIRNNNFLVFLSDGVVKDNYTLYKQSGRGGAFNVAHPDMAITLSGSISILPGGDIVEEDGLKKDTGNAISLAPNSDNSNKTLCPILIDGELSTESVINIDLQTLGAITLPDHKIMKVYNKGNPVNFNGDAPVGKFALRNFVNYTTHTVTPLTDYAISADGNVVSK